MPKFIIKLEDRRRKITRYLDWSTVVDSAISPLMASKDEVKVYLASEYGFNDDQIKERLDLLDKTGCSTPFYTVIDAVTTCVHDVSSQAQLIKIYE